MKLLMFKSEDCAACHQMERFLGDVCDKAKVSLMIADVITRTDLAIQYQVSSLPTLVLFEHGEPFKRLVGGLTENRFSAWLQH